MREGAGTAKGWYKAESFEDAFYRYLPFPSVTTSQPAEIKDFSDFPSVTSDLGVTDENLPKAAETKACDVVTDRNRGSGEEGPYEVEI